MPCPRPIAAGAVSFKRMCGETMKQGIRICKVCGKEYPYCKTFRPEGIFRWQDVACCPEHGSEYFALVMASRGELSPESQAVSPIDADIETEGRYADEEYDPLFEEDFEDEDEEDE